MEKRWIVVIGVALLLLVLLSAIFPDFFARIRESPEPVLPITELPEPFLFLNDVNGVNGRNPTLFNEILNHFNVVSGTRQDDSFIRDLRSKGILYAYALSSYDGRNEEGYVVFYDSAEEMYADFRSPFSTAPGDKGYGIEYGYDAIVIDEVFPDFCAGWPDGEGEIRGQMFVDALAMLREEFPEKIIMAWGTWSFSWGNPTLDCSTVLNGLADYVDMFAPEAYLSEHQRLSLDDPDRYLIGGPVDPFTYFNLAYTNLMNYPDLISKTVYVLYIPQRAPWYVDNSFTINFGAHIDDQVCIIRNNFPDMLEGIAYWGYGSFMVKGDYSYILNSLFTISDHYYLEDLTSCLSDSNDLTNTNIDGSFEREEWTVNGAVTFEDYAGLGGSDLLKNPLDSTRGGYRDSDYQPYTSKYNRGALWAGYVDLGTTFVNFGNEIPPLVAQEKNEISKTLSLDAGVYFLHGYVYTQTRGLPLGIRVYNRGDLLLDYSYPVAVYPENRWDLFEAYFVVLEDASEITLTFSTDSNDLVYLDYIQLEPIFYDLEGFCGEGYGTCDCGETLMTDYVLSEEDPVTQEQCSTDGLIIGQNGISLDCGGYTLKGDGNKKGIVIDSKSDVTIQNCIIDGFYTNIYSSYVDNGMIKDSIIKNSGNDGIGVNLINSAGFNIEGNLFESNDDAIKTWFDSGGHTITKNVIRNNRGNGIFIGPSSYSSTILSNELTDNAREGIYVYGAGSRVEDNKIRNSGDSGIYVSGDSSYIIGNVINDGESDGISVSADEVIVEDNTISSVNTGIDIGMLATDNILLNNMVITSEYGFYVDSEADRTELTGNKIVDVTMKGFRIWGVNGLVMKDNEVERCGSSGVTITNSRNGEIVNNVVSECHLGFDLDHSNNLNLSSNTAKNNRVDGFWFFDSYSLSLIANKALDNLGHGFLIQPRNEQVFVSDIHLENNEASRNVYDGFNLWNVNILSAINNDANYNLGAGFDLARVSNTDFIGNVAQFNGGDGFIFSSSTNNNLENNIASFNYRGFQFSKTSSSLVRNTGCNNRYDFICFEDPEPFSGSLNRFNSLVTECSGDWPVYRENYLYCSDCEDGTLNQQCSSKQPSYCSEGTLLSNCQQCGCPNGKVCGANGECLLKKVRQTSSKA